MKNLIKLILIGFAFISSASIAKEQYRGSLNAPDNRGKEISFQIDLEYEATSDGSITGIYRSWQSGPCKGERNFQGKITEKNLMFKTDTHPLEGCGVHVFRGVKVESSWVGKMNFQGGQRDITFEKR
jgi:hypothetical protein